MNFGSIASNELDMIAKNKFHQWKDSIALDNRTAIIQSRSIIVIRGNNGTILTYLSIILILFMLET